jgi:hypothetical protein
MPGEDSGAPPQGAPEGLLGPDSQPTPQSPTGQSQEEIVKAQMRRFHDLEQQVMAMASTFPQIAGEMRGVSQLLRAAMAKVATQSGRGQEPPAPRGQA